MSISNELWFANPGADAYEIDYAVRFNNDDSAYLTRTPSAGNLTTWTVSVWLKLAGLNLYQTLFCGASNSSNQGGLQFRPGDFLYMWHEDGGSEAQRIQTASLYRDPSAWMHVVAQWDTTDGTAADRHTLWINGVRLTDFTSSTNPGSSKASDWNAGIAQYIGRDGSSSYMDSYLADFVFIDGQALTPTSFGETNADTGQWVPKDPSGLTFGNNGFWLDFADASSLGNDVSGNNNDWTSSGLATNDQVTDTPTDNLTTWASNLPTQPQSVTLSDGGRVAKNSSAQRGGCITTMAVNSGKWYVELDSTSETDGIGIVDAAAFASNIAGGDWTTGNGVNSYSHFPDGRTYNNATAISYGTSWTTGDNMAIALDLDNGIIWWSKNGVWQNSATIAEIEAGNGANAAYTTLDTSLRYQICASMENGADCILRADAADWVDSAPTGFKALRTSSLDTPTIPDPSAHFQATLYTGNATGSRAITQDGNSTFGPDMVWIKNRDQEDEWKALDTTRGATKELNPDSVNAESTDSNGLTAFSGSDGFTLGTGAGGYNDSGEDFVAYQWEEGATPGFDIIGYTGTGSIRTIAHSLNAVPDLIIVKGRNDTPDDWPVYHSANTSEPETEYLRLQRTNATSDNIGFWNDTPPTSSVFTIGIGDSLNANTKLYIAYLFAAVDSFSAFGSYIGNGSSNGPMINLGFKPALVIIKPSDLVDGWLVYDHKISPGNVINDYLFIDTAASEGTDGQRNIDMLSNGFKLVTSHDSQNQNGNAYIYMAWAETPFKTATAR